MILVLGSGPLNSVPDFEKYDYIYCTNASVKHLSKKIEKNKIIHYCSPYLKNEGTDQINLTRRIIQDIDSNPIFYNKDLNNEIIREIIRREWIIWFYLNHVYHGWNGIKTLIINLLKKKFNISSGFKTIMMAVMNNSGKEIHIYGYSLTEFSNYPWFQDHSYKRGHLIEDSIIFKFLNKEENVSFF